MKKNRIIFGVTHPKHVHMFRYLIQKMKSSGYEVLCLVVDKDIVCPLLDKYQIDYVLIDKNKKKFINKVLALPLLCFKTLIHSLKFRPDFFIGQAFPNFAYVSFLLRKPFIILEDTEAAKKLHKFVIPFADTVFTNSYFKRSLGKEEIKLKGSYEFMYLHPNYFTPDIKSLNALGIKEKEKFCILRFVSWSAYHDMGLKGISSDLKIKLVDELQKYCRVFISSEVELPNELKQYEIKIPPEIMHDLLSYASLFFGESATMAAESAIIGTPAIYVDEQGRGYTDELEEKYELMYNFTTSDNDLLKAIERSRIVLSDVNSEAKWEIKREKMIKDKIDVNLFLLWYIENYPNSKATMKNNPDYQERFI